MKAVGGVKVVGLSDQRSPFEEMRSVQIYEWSREARLRDVWCKSITGRRNSQCKGPVAQMC